MVNSANFKKAFGSLKPWAKAVACALPIVVLAGIVAIVVSIAVPNAKLDAKIKDLYENDNIIRIYKRAPNHYGKYFQDSFGMDEAHAAGVLDASETWGFYSLEINASNKHKYAVDLLQLKVENNGENGVWVNSSFGTTYGVPAGLDMQDKIVVEVLVDDISLDIEQVLKIVEKMDISVEYAQSSGYDKDGELITDDKQAANQTSKLMYATLKHDKS